MAKEPSAPDNDEPFVGQVENLRDELLPTEDANKATDPNRPRMPFQTSYVLTRAQEDALTDFASKRVQQLNDQLGRVGDRGTAGGRTGHLRRFLIPNAESFMGKRQKYTLHYLSHVEYRKLPNTIYEVSNLTANIAQRIAQQMIAKAINFFFGQPDDIDWFSTEPVGAKDEVESEKIKKHSRWKIAQCGIKNRLIEAVEYAFIRGEAVIKPTHQQRSQIYKRTATILMGGNGEDGEPDMDEPMLDAHGDYIVQGDAFVPEMQPVEAQNPSMMQNLVRNVKQFFTGPEPGATPESTEGQPAVATPAPNGQQPPNGQQQQAPPMQPTGRQVLKRDGVTVLPEYPQWKEQVITRQLITFEGPDSPVVYYEDFLCPENATDIQTADLIAHLYDMNIMAVAQMFRGQYGEGDDAIKNLEAAVTRLREMASDSNLPKSAATQPRVDMKESDTSGAPAVPICQIAECYLTYDADGDGIQEEIMLVLDRSNNAPIFYDYLANVTVRGQRPFHVLRPMPVDQRWYGMGAMELLDSEQDFIDLSVNRYNFANSKSGRIDFWQPNSTHEGRRDPNMLLNHGRTYTLVDGKKKEDAYDFTVVPFESKDFQWIIQFYLQLMQTKGGVVNARDQAMSGLPTSRTATGVNEITDSGEELFSRMLSHLFPGVKDTLQAVVDIIYANMNRAEVFSYFSGDAMEILSLSPEDVRDLALNVTLELSRTQQRNAVETLQAEQGLIGWFYGLPPELQDRVAGYARNKLKALKVSDADQIISPMQVQPNGQQPEDKPSAVGNALAALWKSGGPVSINDFNAALQKMNLPPISQQDVANHQAAQAQEQAANQPSAEAPQPAESAV